MRDRPPLRELPLPMRGFSEGGAHGRWDPRFTRVTRNMMPRDLQEGRNRPSMRQGVSPIHDFSVARSGSGLENIQAINGTTVYVSGSGRLERMVAVHSGDVYWSNTPTGWTSLSTGVFSATAVVASAIFGNKCYLTDGLVNKVVTLDAATPTIADWTHGGGGSFPKVGSNYPTLACTVGSRVALAGILDAPTNWFLVTINDPTDFTPATDTTLHKMISGDSASLGYGRLGEPIRMLAPFGVRGLVFGCDSSISLLTGDPAIDAGASIIVIATNVGVPGGPNSWCRGDAQDLWVLGTDGLYHLTSNDFMVQKGRSISAGRMDRFFQRIPWDFYRACLAWDNERRGVWIFITPTAKGRTGRHVFYHPDTDSFWLQQFSDDYWDGALCAFNAHPATSSNPVLLLGGAYSRLATFANDRVRPYDGYPYPGGNSATKSPASAVRSISAAFRVGPIADTSHDRAMLKCVSVILDEFRYAPQDTDVPQEFDYPRLTARAGPTAEATGGSAVFVDPVVIGRISRFALDGGDAASVSPTATYDGGDASEVTFADGTLDGRMGREPTGVYEVDDPSADWTALDWFNDAGYKLEAVTYATPESRTWKLTAPDGVIDFLSVGGVIEDPNNPVVFQSAYPVAPDPIAELDDADALEALQQATGVASSRDLGELSAGKNSDRNTALAGAGLALDFTANGYPLCIDTVAADIRPRGRSRTVQANR